MGKKFSSNERRQYWVGYGIGLAKQRVSNAHGTAANELLNKSKPPVTLNLKNGMNAGYNESSCNQAIKRIHRSRKKRK